MATAGRCAVVNCKYEIMAGSFINMKLSWHRIKRGPLVDETCHIGKRCNIISDLETGVFCYIGDDCEIGPAVKLGSFVVLSPRVAIIGGDHRFDCAGTPMIFSGRQHLDPTCVHSDVWIGFGSIVLAGITVGQGAIVKAGSIVTKDVPPYSVVGGIPAKFMRSRFGSDTDRDIHQRTLDSATSHAHSLAGFHPC